MIAGCAGARVFEYTDIAQLPAILKTAIGV
jgi:hypothetical protein